ncbi:MAG TPA: glucosamine-6-phosphate isomerase [Terriglobia bacterium]|nr:glucosamine-6-phosphate isomerase [Terriglobia bacterium]
MTLEEQLSLPAEELVRRARMGLRLFPDVAAMMDYLARSMADEIRDRNSRGEPTRWILPVGPVAQYSRLVEITNRERIGWKNVFTFQMDEFLDWQARPLPLDHPMSFEGFMRRQVFEKIDPDLRPDPSNLHFPDPFNPDSISQKIQETGGVDSCFGGIGYHGHVAFNEPPGSRWFKITAQEMRESLTRVVALGDDSIVVQSISCAGGNSASIPPMAVTLGMKDILASRRIRLFLAGGERHRAIFRITLLGDETPDYPSTLLQGHPDCVVHTDLMTARPVHPSLF